ncbi:ribonuclease E/G [Comamonas serinivorans]|uniref:Ribonuclease G n=1 Tax=Comamonas serinivorans TaxID=1082851 RepID=A0A1Y0ENV0_9BURK|nr:ribonuclease G [Comamonas serinivorans]ARU05128.1 ribonuclease E/G [Comamonas serinivorans]
MDDKKSSANAQEILVNWSPQEVRVAVVESAAVQELHIERTQERGLVGNIYLGKVSRVLPGMQSAFIDIGLDRAAFLHVADVMPRTAEGGGAVSRNGGQGLPPIEKQIFEGQTLLVQVIKDPIGTKGARLSTQISIAGRMLVFLPQDDHIGISQKIAPEMRDALRDRMTVLARDAFDAEVKLAQQQGDKPPSAGGFILRTNAEDASDAELAEDIAYLRAAWARIRKDALRLPPKNLLRRDLDLLERVLRDLVSDQTQSIRIDSREQHARMLVFAQEFMPTVVERIQHYKGERPIFDLFSIEDELAKALGRRVDLKSGGYLIVDQTEALTTFDVNTGGYVGARNFDETVFKTNLEAAHAIARQLRLRNLGGIVIVDFIDMVKPEHQQAVLVELRRQLERDRVKTSVSGFSSLGLVEMTRKRTRESLAHMLCEPCPVCQGVGEVKTARTVAYDILREILREARQFNPQEFRVIATPTVIELLLDDEQQYLAGLSEFIGKPISLQSESAMGPVAYDIILR